MNAPQPYETELARIGEALQLVARLAQDPQVHLVLGASYCTELTTAAAGFRQRFPHHWPSVQQQLPLE